MRRRGRRRREVLRRRSWLEEGGGERASERCLLANIFMGRGRASVNGLVVDILAPGEIVFPQTCPCIQPKLFCALSSTATTSSSPRRSAHTTHRIGSETLVQCTVRRLVLARTLFVLVTGDSRYTPHRRRGKSIGGRIANSRPAPLDPDPSCVAAVSAARPTRAKPVRQVLRASRKHMPVFVHISTDSDASRRRGLRSFVPSLSRPGAALHGRPRMLPSIVRIPAAGGGASAGHARPCARVSSHPWSPAPPIASTPCDLRFYLSNDDWQLPAAVMRPTMQQSIRRPQNAVQHAPHGMPATM